LALIRSLGRDPQVLVQLFSESAGDPNVLKLKASAVAAALAGDPNIAPTFDLNTMRKDLRVMLEEAATRGITLPVAAQTLLAFDAASAAGFGERDCAYVPAYWVSKTGCS
jgi:3-hydroxyisobutyrate dehydrogenase